MSDIFISYARDNRKTAQQLARALEAQGWSVWWDTRLKAGEVWDEVIGRELAAARCVIVLWSKASVQRNWVREEAREGLRRGILVPVRIENVEPPLPFKGLQAVDLINWKGQRGHPGFKQFMLDIGIARVPRSPRFLPRFRRPAVPKLALPSSWEPGDFDRELAPYDFPPALATAVALRQREARIGDELVYVPTPAGRMRGTAPPPPADAAPTHRSILLKVIIYSAIAALTVIGLEALGVKILPFLNMTRKENTESDSDGNGGEETCSGDCSVVAPPAISVGHWMMVQIFLHPPDIADTVEETALTSDTTSALRGFSSLSLLLKNGARVGFQLEVPDLGVSD